METKETMSKEHSLPDVVLLSDIRIVYFPYKLSFLIIKTIEMLNILI